MKKKILTLLSLFILGEINLISPSSANIIIEQGATVHKIETDHPVESNPENLKNLSEDTLKIVIKEGANVDSINYGNSPQCQDTVFCKPSLWDRLYNIYRILFGHFLRSSN